MCSTEKKLWDCFYFRLDSGSRSSVTAACSKVPVPERGRRRPPPVPQACPGSSAKGGQHSSGPCPASAPLRDLSSGQPGERTLEARRGPRAAPLLPHGARWAWGEIPQLPPPPGSLCPAAAPCQAVPMGMQVSDPTCPWALCSALSLPCLGAEPWFPTWSKSRVCASMSLRCHVPRSPPWSGVQIHRPQLHPQYFLGPWCPWVL